ncbi:hypothetical protein D9619_008895 [Psilocybe cf. subviscida]|uniref:Protein kinase domain-containing protein n=1 Tax=Psilocybe cf. subviscida TaxID=2480587 RepID=A0A8H5B9U5_9AGAR|nr:hypothetical protein D9619_008895 [Psilocybe cf. subviscida]
MEPPSKCDEKITTHGAHVSHDDGDDNLQQTAHTHTASPSPASNGTSAPSPLAAFPDSDPAKNAEKKSRQEAIPTSDKGNRCRPWYLYAAIDGVENVEKYRPGGLLPISLGDGLHRGRYIVLQKLGHGGSSTIWLAHDPDKELVTLKAMCADESQQDPSQIPDWVIPRRLQSLYPHTDYFRTPSRYFYESSQNGNHLVLVYPLAGPNVASLYALPTNHYWQPPKPAGSRRFRIDLARKVAKETAMGLYQMHSAGIVHGGEYYLYEYVVNSKPPLADLTTSNILVRTAPSVLEWSDAEVKARFGEPVTDKVKLLQGGSHGAHAPPLLYEPIPILKFSDASLLQEHTIIHDFGKSYLAAAPPADYRPGTIINYTPPEMFFDGRCAPAADIWMLACLIHEVRTGLPLFDLAWSTHDGDLVMHMVETLGRLPEPWWAAFAHREEWFYDDGRVRSEEEQMRAPGIGAGRFELAVAEPLHAKLRKTGTHGPSGVDEGPMCEPPGVRMEEDEVELLGDLLGKMLRYKPEERITIEEVIEHPWFSYRP